MLLFDESPSSPALSGAPSATQPAFAEPDGDVAEPSSPHGSMRRLVTAAKPTVTEHPQLIGRTAESLRQRQLVYISRKTEGFTADEAPGDVVPAIANPSGASFTAASGVAVNMLMRHNTHRQHFSDCHKVITPSLSSAPSILAPWHETPVTAPNTSAVHVDAGQGSFRAATSQRPEKSKGQNVLSPRSVETSGPALSAAETAAMDKRLLLNCFDENQLSETGQLWWKDPATTALSHEALQDVPPDLFMEVCYPQQGFYTKMSAEVVEKYSWNERFQAVFNMSESSSRREQMAAFVRDFTAEAVPLAMEVLANLHLLTTPLLHKGGITVEIMSGTAIAKTMFDPLRALKLNNREFVGRQFAAVAACPQLNVPFTLLVEYKCLKALVYPQLPLTGCEELVYGMENPQWFHEESFLQRDAEVNAIVQRLALLVKCRGQWLGREFHEKHRAFVYGGLDTKVHRSSLDNRIYATCLRRITASNIVPEAVTTSNGDVAAHIRTSAASSSSVASVATAQRPNDYFLNTFRPEFVSQHQKGDLGCESASPLAKINVDHDEPDRLKCVDELIEYVIPQAAEQLSRDVRLNGVDWPFIRCGGLSHFLHSWGINLRYLPLIHHKLVRTKLSGTALQFVETEIVARALKQRAFDTALNPVTGVISETDLSECLYRWMQPFTVDVWDSVVWPSVLKKYPSFAVATAQKWEVSRVDHEKIIQRLLRMMGVSAFLTADDAIEIDNHKPISSFSWIDRQHASELSSLLRLEYWPVVKCPIYPRAPLEEGQDVHLMIIAKRYIREVTFDLKHNPVSNREMLERYIGFLEQVGEKSCEEILAFYSAEQERKDRVLRGSKPTVYSESGKDKKTLKYRLRDNRGMRVVDISREATEIFKFFHGQRVQQTLGADSGKISTIVGVLDEALLHHENGADGAVELFGRNYGELQANYGLVNLDKLLQARRYFLQTIQQLVQISISNACAIGSQQQSNSRMSVSRSRATELPAAWSTSPDKVTLHDVSIRCPLHIHFGDRGLLILETSVAQLQDHFGVESGARLMFVEGPRRGQVTTIIGSLDGTMLLHQVDGSLNFETIRTPPPEQLLTLHRNRQRFQAFRDDEVVVLQNQELRYPIDSVPVYGMGFDIYAGYRLCAPCGFYYRQVVVLKKGPFVNSRCVILGANGGILQALKPFDHVPLSLGLVHADIVEEHAPQVLGTLSYDVRAEPPPFSLLYPALGGDMMVFDGSYYAGLRHGGVRGQRIKMLRGALAGICGFVVGVRKGRLWAQLDGEPGAQPVDPSNFVVIAGSVFVPDKCTFIPAEVVPNPACVANVFPRRDASNLETDQVRDLAFRFLAFWGEVILFDASPVACAPFGYFHSQRLRMQRWPRLSATTPLSADTVMCVVVGVFHGELFVVEEGDAVARPLGARAPWRLENMYAIEVVDIVPLSPWRDIFCGDYKRVQSTCVDEFFEDDAVLVAYCTESQMVIGLSTRQVDKLHKGWSFETTLIRQDRIISEVDANGHATLRPDGPQATVRGHLGGVIYIEYRAEFSVALGNPSIAAALPRVTPLPPVEFHKWITCPKWDDMTQETFLPPEQIITSTDFESRQKFRPPESPTYAMWWGYMAPMPAEDIAESSVPLSMKQQQLILFDRSTSHCLEKLFEQSGGKSGSHYDADGGAYSIEAMTYTIKADGASSMSRPFGSGKTHSGVKHRSNAAASADEESADQTFTLVREPLETVDSYCEYAFRVHLSRHFPLQHSAIDDQVARVIRQRFPGISARQITQRRQTITVFAQQEREALHQVCEVVPEMINFEVQKHAATVEPKLLNELRLRYASTPPALLPLVLRWVLQLMSVTAFTENSSVDHLMRLLSAMEVISGDVMDVPTLPEIQQHIRDLTYFLLETELQERRTIAQEERNARRCMLPSFSAVVRKGRQRARWESTKRLGQADVEVAGAPTSSNSQTVSAADVSENAGTFQLLKRDHIFDLELPHELQNGELDTYAVQSLRVMQRSLKVCMLKYDILMQHRTPENASAARKLPHWDKFTLEDGTEIIFEPSSMPFRRGDLVEYTKGDLGGIRAKILGMYRGWLWRVEISDGLYKGQALPFAGDASDIDERYGLRLISSEDPGRIMHRTSSIDLPACNRIRCLCYDGLIREIDLSTDDIRRRFGVSPGDRFVTTSSTNYDQFPFFSLVVTVFGTSNDHRLWFAVDQTGLLPFPERTAPAPIGSKENDIVFDDICERFALRHICWSTIRQPAVRPGAHLLACQGVVGPEEGAVIGRSGPMTLVFHTSPQVLAGVSVTSGTKVQVDSGEQKGRRFVVVGFRHGKLWVMWEYDNAARPLRRPMTSFEFKILPETASGSFRSLESTTSIATLPQQAVPTPESPWLRFPTQRGGLALFSTHNVEELFQLRCGQEIEYAAVARLKKSLPKKKAVIVGIRDGALWKVDAFDTDAKPFIGAQDLASLEKKFVIKRGRIVGIESQTW